MNRNPRPLACRTRLWRWTRHAAPVAGLVLLAACSTPRPTQPGPSPATTTATPEASSDWPQWRGPLGTGVAPAADPPLEWSETSNVKWKVKVPGSGTSTPIVVGNRIFLLAAINTGRAPEGGATAGRPRAGSGGGMFQIDAPRELYQFLVLCLDRGTGQTLWSKVVREELPHEGHHRDHGFASFSPVTDGRRLWAFFGSRGLYCLDFEGTVIWEKDFGDMTTRNSFGEGSSPALHGDSLVVLWDHEGDDFLVALNKHTGEEQWRQTRDEPTGWTTPLVVQHGGRPQVVVNGTNKVRGYDLATGQVLWECSGQTANAIPTPVAAEGVVYVTSGFRGAALQAIKVSARGELSRGKGILWTHDKHTPYVPSPLLVEGRLYFFSNNQGLLSCLDARTGQPHYEAERLEEIRGVYASPVAAGDRIYLLARDGRCVVIRNAPRLELLAVNRLEERTDASMAIAGRELFIRGQEHLYCLTGGGQPTPGTPTLTGLSR